MNAYCLKLIGQLFLGDDDDALLYALSTKSNHQMKLN